MLCGEQTVGRVEARRPLLGCYRDYAQVVWLDHWEMLGSGQMLGVF